MGLVKRDATISPVLAASTRLDGPDKPGHDGRKGSSAGRHLRQADQAELQHQPQHPQHLSQQHRTAQKLLQQAMHALVAVYALRPQPQLAFKIGIAVFELGIDARRVAGEHMVLFLQAPHQLYVCHP